MRRALVVLGVMFVALLTALPASAQPAAASVSIDIGDDWFCSPSFEGQVCQTALTAGDVVTWNYPNTGDSVHTVTQCTDTTFTDCSINWSPGPLYPGQSFQRSFDSSGTFYYRCDFHPTKMRGRLDVSAAPAPTPPPDSDHDGFTDEAEAFLGTDPIQSCAATPTANDEPEPGAWPVDADDNQFVNLLDVLPMKQHFNTTDPDPGYNPRFDLQDQNGTINLLDVLPYKAFFLTSCAP